MPTFTYRKVSYDQHANCDRYGDSGMRNDSLLIFANQDQYQELQVKAEEEEHVKLEQHKVDMV